MIEIPPDLLIEKSDDPILSLVNFAYPKMINNMKNHSFFEERAILAPTIESVEHVNNFMSSMVPGDEKEYLSFDITCKSDEDTEIEGDWFTYEFLNEVKCSRIPNHKLNLKVGIPIMLLRNIDQSIGLCNRTRLIVTDLTKNVIAASILIGKKMGENFLIPRMNLIPSDPGLSFKFSRRQFPVTLCISMTINKSQGQSLSHVGLYLPRPVFTHGKLYVALSRVKSRKGLKLLILDDEGNLSNATKNVVYQEVFDNI
ncbi:uncharacterized protein LOC130727337 [Lotus japonicus]|uniref:uncharacterized protein LOC130727337 n=1 Tax=Lotus japonicus TaxID=34305 RepID=UPI00258DCDD6|nr:uncharacterized protein LOC130727337 [Lotus japonicus]